MVLDAGCLVESSRFGKKTQLFELFYFAALRGVSRANLRGTRDDGRPTLKHMGGMGGRFRSASQAV